MSDHTFNDLRDEIDGAIRDAEYGNFYPAVDFTQATQNVIAVIAKWAEGGLIDVATWTRLDRKPVGWDWCATANKPLPSRRNLDPCGNDAPLFTLTSRRDE